MKYLYLLIIFMITSTVSSANANPSLLPDQLKSPFRFLGGLMFVEATVNGTKGLFLIDTGSNSFILLNSAHFDAQATGQALSGMAGTVSLQQVKVRSLEWQNLKLSDQMLPAADMRQLSTGTNEKVLGLIGSGFFRSYQLTLNFAGRQLELNKTPVEPPVIQGIPPIIRLPFVLVNGFPVVEVSIAGRNHRFVMDTGATDNLMDLGFEKSISTLWKQMAEVNMTEGSGNGAKVRRGILDRMHIGGLNMDKIQMGLNALPDFDKEKGISGILGFQFLKYFYVDINYIDKTMRFYDMALVLQRQGKS